ncbi:MAG: histone deacetylase [Elusimicrobiota bacterium]
MGRVFSDLATATYGAPGHPEAPFRVIRSHARLISAGHKVEKPLEEATGSDVALLHGVKHFHKLQKGSYSDPDTPLHPGIVPVALISLAGALSAAKTAAAGEPALSLMRPPGHHAGKDRVSGFCYFNNAALACEKLKVEKQAARIAILDIDVHHGDGTQELTLGREGYFFASLHQVPLYPGTGLDSVGNCRNYPLAPGTDEGPYLKKLEEVLRLMLDFKPDVLAVSAGFDTYKEDPIAQLKLTKQSYTRIGSLIAQTKLRRFAVLEGGYAEDLPILVENFLEGFF